MDTMAAFEMAKANQDNELMVFDWDKAANLIKASPESEFGAGLSGDWEWTGGDIWSDGKPIPEEDTYVYLSSTWATPEISINGVIQDCYKMQSKTPNWNADTYYPVEAKKILGIK